MKILSILPALFYNAVLIHIKWQSIPHLRPTPLFSSNCLILPDVFERALLSGLSVTNEMEAMALHDNRVAVCCGIGGGSLVYLGVGRILVIGRVWMLVHC